MRKRKDPDKYNKASRLWSDGVPATKIAKICNVSPLTVYNWIRRSKENISSKREEAVTARKEKIEREYMAGVPVKKLAAEYDVSVATIYRWISLAG